MLPFLGSITAPIMSPVASKPVFVVGFKSNMIAYEDASSKALFRPLVVTLALMMNGSFGAFRGRLEMSKCVEDYLKQPRVIRNSTSFTSLTSYFKLSFLPS